MQAAQPSAARRSRGRPQSTASTDVYEKLVSAAEKVIVTHGHFDCSEKDIAQMAGVSAPMITYYFESKEALLFTVLDKVMWEASGILSEARAACFATHPEGTDPVRSILGSLIRYYASHPEISRIAIAEMANPHSIITQTYKKRYGCRTISALKSIFDGLVEAGMYEREMNTSFAAITLYSLLAGPMMLYHIVEDFDPAFKSLHNERWIDFVTALFNAQFAAGRHACADPASDAMSMTKR